MFRSSCLALTAICMLGAGPTADAQRNNADIVQGLSSSQLTATVEELRVSNAELRARMTGIESDKAQLNGKVETLEFLLGQTRDQINRMQSDDAELQRLITRLEGRISEQEQTIGELNRRLAALQPEPAFLSPGASDAPAQGPSEPSFASEGDDEMVTAASSGPTRIVRPSDATLEDPQPDPSLEASADQAGALPQGSLGTISASALPGDAGPLFAEAKSRLLRFDYAGAEAAFRSFLSQFGDEPKAGAALIW